MELEQLRIFTRVARAGGMSGAARQLYISHSAVSRAMSALEQELETALFRRTNRGIELTAAGQVLLEEAERLLAAADAAAERVRNVDRDTP